jgi:hypothetical protein
MSLYCAANAAIIRYDFKRSITFLLTNGKARGSHKRRIRSRSYGESWGISVRRSTARHRVLDLFAQIKTTLLLRTEVGYTERRIHQRMGVFAIRHG